MQTPFTASAPPNAFTFAKFGPTLRNFSQVTSGGDRFSDAPLLTSMLAPASHSPGASSLRAAGLPMALLSRSSVIPVPEVIRIVLVPRSSTAPTEPDDEAPSADGAGSPVAPLVQGLAGSEAMGAGTVRRCRSGGGEDEHPATSPPRTATATKTRPSVLRRVIPHPPAPGAAARAAWRR